jgi:hypothetical protein
MAPHHRAKLSHRNVIDLGKPWPYSARIFWSLGAWRSHDPQHWEMSGMRRLRRIQRERATI